MQDSSRDYMSVGDSRWTLMWANEQPANRRSCTSVVFSHTYTIGA